MKAPLAVAFLKPALASQLFTVGTAVNFPSCPALTKALEDWRNLDSNASCTGWHLTSIPLK